MDTELLRTFIEITRTKHFGRAAANLYLTQSAVSARMRLLEDTLGVRLMTRTRNDLQLTPAGRTLLDHAEEIVNRWTQARQAVAIRDEGRVAIKAVTVAATADVLFEGWLNAITDAGIVTSIRLEVLDEAATTRRFEEGTVDLAIMFDASNDQRLRSKQIRPLRLALLSGAADLVFERKLDDDYIFVEWGSWFDLAHAKHFPDYLPGPLHVPYPRLAAAVVQRTGGSAYLPATMASESLNPVADAPDIERAMYAVFPADSDRRSTIEQLVDLLT